MAGSSLTITASIQCPHGGTVQITSSNAHASAGGGFLATAADTFAVVGCPFQLPATPPIPSPCLTVQWAVPDVQVKVGGAPSLSRSCTGLCFGPSGAPQGPATVAPAQAKVSSR
jgi:hypothetical protein